MTSEAERLAPNAAAPAAAPAAAVSTVCVSGSCTLRRRASAARPTGGASVVLARRSAAPAATNTPSTTADGHVPRSESRWAYAGCAWKYACINAQDAAARTPSASTLAATRTLSWPAPPSRRSLAVRPAASTAQNTTLARTSTRE